MSSTADFTQEHFDDWPLHDAVLNDVRVDWRERICCVRLAVFLLPGRRAERCLLTFSEVRSVSLPHHAEWGDSVFVNSQRRASPTTFQIEMQTGDLLEVEAGAAALVPEARDGPKDSSEPRTLPEAQIGTAREALTRDCEAFLDALRPYTGTLPSALFHSVMHSLRVIGPTLSREDIVERSTVSALWGLCHLAKRWALDPDSMLRQNHLLAEVDRKTLEGWIDSMSHAVMMLLDGQNVDVAFAEYEDLRRAAG